MNLKYSFLTFLKLLALTVILTLPMRVCAKEINLYDQPNSTKAIGTIDLSAGIIPIFTPKDGLWIKIANPKNGNVGWVKVSDLKNAGTQSIFTFSQSINNSTPLTYRVIQFGNPIQLTPEATQTFIKHIQDEQQAMQKSLQNMMQDMDHLFNDDWNLFHDQSFPFYFPVKSKSEQKSTQALPIKKQVPKPMSSTPMQNNVHNQTEK